MKKFWQENRDKIITVLFSSALFVGVLSILALFCGAVMKLFGFTYRSVGSIVVFFIAAGLLSLPANLVAKALPKVLLLRQRVSKREAILLFVALDTAMTAMGLTLVDYWMDGVSASGLSILAVSFLLSLPDAEDIGKPPEGRNLP